MTKICFLIRKTSRQAAMLRAVLVVLVISGYTLLAGPVSIVIAKLRGNRDILYRVGRLGCRLALKLGGIRVQVEGLENIEPARTYVFTANHQGNCDPVALLISIASNIRFIAKKEVAKLPVIGVMMKLGGFVFLDRQDRLSAVQAMNEAVSQLRQGHSFLIFPEGTRTRTGAMGPFKKGPFMMAILAGVPILPITISGSFEIMPPGRFRLRPGTIRLRFHPAIETRGLGLQGRDRLRKQVWETIASGQQNTPASLTQLSPIQSAK